MSKKTVQDLILEEIKDINSKLDKVLEEEIPGIKTRVKVVEIRSGIWGGLTGVLGGVLTAIGFSLRQ